MHLEIKSGCKIHEVIAFRFGRFGSFSGLGCWAKMLTNASCALLAKKLNLPLACALLLASVCPENAHAAHIACVAHRRIQREEPRRGIYCDGGISLIT